MNFSSFKEKAYPAEKAAYDAHLTFVSRWYRYFGLYLGYFFYLIKVSANAVSLLRVLMVLAGFAALTLPGKENFTLRVLAVAVLLLSKVLDYADGAIARAMNRPSLLGAKLDSFSDRIVRAGMALVLFGYFSNHLFLIPYAVFLQWVIHQFGKPLSDKKYSSREKTGVLSFVEKQFFDTGAESAENRTNNLLVIALNLFCKVFKADLTHFVFLPIIIAVFNNPEDSGILSEISIVILAIYSIVASIRFIGGIREYAREGQE